MTSLHRAAASVAGRLSEALAEQLAAAIRQCDGPTPVARGLVMARHPSPGYREAATALFDAWECEPASGAELASALLAARQATAMLRDEQRVDIVWTGPANGTMPVRATREVLVELIRAARSSIILVSFVAYKNYMVLAELSGALDRGVAVWAILETNTSAADAFATLAHRMHTFTWPIEQRPDVGRRTAVLHAKCVLVDDSLAFVTSANLTAAALDSNIELGLLITGGDVPHDLAHQIRDLIRAGVLVET